MQSYFRRKWNDCLIFINKRNQEQLAASYTNKMNSLNIPHTANRSETIANMLKFVAVRHFDKWIFFTWLLCLSIGLSTFSLFSIAAKIWFEYGTIIFNDCAHNHCNGVASFLFFIISYRTDKNIKILDWFSFVQAAKKKIMQENLLCFPCFFFYFLLLCTQIHISLRRKVFFFMSRMFYFYYFTYKIDIYTNTLYNM